MVLVFESEFSMAQARSWIRSFNLKNLTKLTIVDELPNALLVAQFDSPDLAITKSHLLEASPLLGVGKVYAVVNDYTLTFDPCNQADFWHLVTVNIPNGSRALYDIIQFLFASIGKFVKGVFGADNCHMSVVVESTIRCPLNRMSQFCG